MSGLVSKNVDDALQYIRIIKSPLGTASEKGMLGFQHHRVAASAAADSSINTASVTARLFESGTG